MFFPVQIPWKHRPDSGARVNRSHPLAEGMLGLWLMGGETDPKFIVNLLDGTITGLTSTGNPLNIIDGDSRAIWNNNSYGYVVQENYELQSGFSAFEHVYQYDLSKDHSLFTFGTTSNFSVWQDNNLGGLRIAGQPNNSYGTDGELDGRHTWGVSHLIGAEKRYFIDGMNTKTVSMLTPAVTTAQLRMLGNPGEVRNSKGYHKWVAMWNRDLTVEEGEFVTAHPDNILDLLEPRTIWLPLAAGGTPVSQSFTASIESLTSQAQAIASQVEALQGLQVPAVSAAENLITCASSFPSLMESLTGLNSQGSTIIESLMTASQSGVAQFESVQGLVAVSKEATSMMEWLQGVSHALPAPFAVLSGLARSESGQLESVAQVVVTGAAAMEALQQTSQGLEASVEALALVNAAATSPIEVIGAGIAETYEDLVMVLSGEHDVEMILTDIHDVH